MLFENPTCLSEEFFRIGKVFNNLKSRFAQSRLTEGAVVRGRDMANANTIRAYMEKLYLDLAGR